MSPRCKLANCLIPFSRCPHFTHFPAPPPTFPFPFCAAILVRLPPSALVLLLLLCHALRHEKTFLRRNYILFRFHIPATRSPPTLPPYQLAPLCFFFGSMVTGLLNLFPARYHRSPCIFMGRHPSLFCQAPVESPWPSISTSISVSPSPYSILHLPQQPRASLSAHQSTKTSNGGCLNYVNYELK